MSASDFFRKFQPLFEAKEDNKKDDKIEVKKPDEEKKPTNVKETAAEFFRKYSDMVTEAESCTEDEDDEDEDVKIADKEKGKDKKTQKDSEKGKKWNFEKADKKDEDKSAKKVAKGDED